MSIDFTTPDLTGPELNMASGNAVRLLSLLGYTPDEDDWSGEAEPGDLLGRILIAQALLPAATDDAHGRPTVTDGNWTWFGTRPGYLAGRLAELADLAEWAQRHGHPVRWH